MMNITNTLRKNIGIIVACLGFMLLCIVTFGDLGELFGDEYWKNVLNNITSISFVSIGLTFIQTSIRQGLAEQALQRGLNTDRTSKKYEEHRDLIKDNTDRIVYLPYFLQIYNKRHTKLRRREFLLNNGFSSEESLLQTNRRKLIREYRKIHVNITPRSIKWSTIDVVYNENSQIITLDEYRRKRLFNALVSSFVGMIGATFLAGGLFFSPSQEPIWQKFVKLFTYMIAIAINAVFTIIKEYEKGAFGVPNDLDEINQIWHEFSQWEIPQWVLDDVEKLNKESNELDHEKEVVNNEGNTTNDGGRYIQEEPQEIENICDSGTNELVSVSDVDDDFLCSGDTQ